jgi:hypothetical protein
MARTWQQRQENHVSNQDRHASSGQSGHGDAVVLAAAALATTIEPVIPLTSSPSLDLRPRKHTKTFTENSRVSSRAAVIAKRQAIPKLDGAGSSSATENNTSTPDNDTSLPSAACYIDTTPLPAHCTGCTVNVCFTASSSI